MRQDCTFIDNSKCFEPLCKWNTQQNREEKQEIGSGCLEHHVKKDSEVAFACTEKNVMITQKCMMWIIQCNNIVGSYFMLLKQLLTSCCFVDNICLKNDNGNLW